MGESGEYYPDMEELYKENAKIVYHFLYGRCHDEKTAEDLTQETFLQAYLSIHRYDHSCKISTWLCQIAKHLWYRYLEKHKRELPADEIDTEAAVNRQNADMAGAAEASAEKRVFTRLELLDVLKDMQELPPQTREVIYLRAAGELSFKEIGEILGKSENWARVTFYRGKEALLQKREQG